MQIWVDADACPGVIRDILFRAAERTGVLLTLVANQAVKIPPLRNVRSVQVQQGFDVADNAIIQGLVAGDLVITSDIPLAADAIAKGALALSPRGELLTEGNVRPRLNMRDFLDTLRASGVHTGGPPPLSQRDRQIFASHLDSILERWRKNISLANR
ncbi:MAG: YaiI/YqxD family protein [Pseudomonadales bacterium]|jgi:uncharacterized protein YaiI (UPF0178 family)|nr:YaiI/YqxD family protein [Pseudomonadales bacterium]